MLDTRKIVISDEALGYLVSHEMLHDVPAVRGHDHGFRTYESHWPNAPDHDALCDGLEEDYNLDPRRHK